MNILETVKELFVSKKEYESDMDDLAVNFASMNDMQALVERLDQMDDSLGQMRKNNEVVADVNGAAIDALISHTLMP